MIIDLTLDSLKFPGLENYTPPFGTKKGDNVGLTTAEGCANLAKPWQDQRPIVISENSSSNANIERNATIEIDTASITLTLTDAAFEGCKLTILATFSTGTATIVLPDNTTATINATENIDFIYIKGKWEEQHKVKEIRFRQETVQITPQSVGANAAFSINITAPSAASGWRAEAIQASYFHAENSAAIAATIRTLLTAGSSVTVYGINVAPQQNVTAITFDIIESKKY